MRPFLADLGHRLDALATLVYGPLPMDEYRVGLGAKLAVLLVFAALLRSGSWRVGENCGRKGAN